MLQPITPLPLLLLPCVQTLQGDSPRESETPDKKAQRVLAMDRELFEERSSRGGRDNDQGERRGGRGGGRGKETSYADQAASPPKSTKDDEFKEYALALRSRDRRGRDNDAAAASREKEKGRFHYDRDHVS